LAAACRNASAPPSAASVVPAAPTYSRDVAPIITKHCVTCHRPQQGAPFVLLTYEDARRRSADIAAVTKARQMPPWLPDTSAPAFEGERRLSDTEIETLQRWSETGAVAGDATAVIQDPGTAWQLGRPDVILQPPAPFMLGAGRDDVFRNLVVRTSFEGDRFVRAVEFQPGDAPVHHAVLHLDQTPASRRRDGEDGQPGFGGMGAAGAEDPEGHFVGWAPGRGPIVSATGRPWRLRRGVDLVVELHLIPGAQPAPIKPAIALYFADAPADAPPMMLKLGDPPIDIPPGATDYAITDEYVVPVDAKVLSLYPHAHYLGKEMRVEARLPGGGTKTLLHIPRWSFHWQQDYRCVAPVQLPRGTTIAMRFTYDNSEANTENPHHPPLRVTSGLRSTDEMGNLLVQLLPANDSERDLLAREIARFQVLRQLAAAERAAMAAPADARVLNELGALLLIVGRTADAVARFQAAAAAAPKDARILYNLGKAESAAGSAQAAEAALRRAIASDPSLAEAHNELGALLFARGRLTDAIAALGRAVKLAPDSSAFRSDYGGALAQSGRRTEAIAELTRALALDPGNAAARENLTRLQRGRD